ncbi:hypothetical protein RSAG8_04542, partial [Rhizoctonia solani AG-8 WAC10335]
MLRRVFVGAAFALGLGFVRAQASEGDIQTLYERRLPFVVASSLATPQLKERYMSTLGENGKWPDVNYATGCDAQRANWPAGIHWNRILVLAAVYHGGVNGTEQDARSPAIRAALSRSMEYWFANDFGTVANGACLDRGGVSGEQCPCGTPGLWNSNWFSNVILVPTLVGKTCLLLRDELTPTELGNCTAITARAYAPFYRNPQPGYVSGANIIDMSSVGISAGLLENNRTGNASRIMDAYERVHNETVVHDKDLVDGIKPDGSFQQHIGMVYDGNYGKDFSNSLLELELQAADTPFQANASVRDQALGDAWNSTQLQRFATDLSKPIKTANAGYLTGNRMFWNSDYMVHRTKKTVTTVRMLSNRTKTSECVNTQNPLGFHLSDGAMYQYSTGQEYLDMYATLDWNLIPGTTVDYNATVLNCSTTEKIGITTYAGGVSAGDVGIAAMQYTNPRTNAFSFKKAWFFFKDNVQHVLVNGISSTSSAPVYSVLDQRLHKGPIYLDGEQVTTGNYCDVDSLWHAGTGYVFPESQGTEIMLDEGEKTGNWSKIGTSTQGNVTKDMFSASIVHDQTNLGAPMEYSIFPATESNDEFEAKAETCTPETVVNDGSVSAALDYDARTLGAAFWNVGGGSVRVDRMGLTVYADRPLVLVLKLTGKNKDNHSGSVSVADPTHGSGHARVRLVWSSTGSFTSHPECKRMLGHVGARHSGHRCHRQTPNETVLEFDLPKHGSGHARVRLVWSSTGSSTSHPECKRMLGHVGARHSGHRCHRQTPNETVLEFDLPKGGLAGSGLTQDFKRATH